jgi:molybdopterin biosynthesis enzyme
MNPPTETLQRISRLAPLGEAMKLIQTLAPVAARETETAAAVGATLAADIAAPADLPAAAVALRDGWAVASDAISDAGPYAPAPLPLPPAWVETGDRMPAGTDAVLPLDAVTVNRAGASALASATPGDGVIAAGADAAAGNLLRRAGERLRPSDVALLLLADVTSVSVRAPRVKIFCASVPTRGKSDTLSPLIARMVEAESGIAQVAQAASLESALLDRACDAVITIGGTGAGRRDASVKTLARVGEVAVHGIGISPGETAAFGSVNGRPVLMLPGRLDGALASFLVLGRALLRRLADRRDEPWKIRVPLARKVTSTVGIADMVLVRRAGEGAEPLGSNVFTASALARASGWILVPPESEGFAAGAEVEMEALL